MSATTQLPRAARLRRALRRKTAAASDLGQTAIVAVVSFSVLAALVGGIVVTTIFQNAPALDQQAIQIYAREALQAGQNAFLAAVNANPTLAQCNSNMDSDIACSGISYGTWTLVQQSDNTGSDPQYYAFGNPQPVLDSSTNALNQLTVQVVGAAYDPTTPNHYRFEQESVTVTPSNGFLQNVWWSNYETYSATGNYSGCNYNWKLDYNVSKEPNCTPVYFGPNDFLFGPTHTNDSVFVSGDGNQSDSPSFGTRSDPSAVSTADPNCLFVDDDGTNDGMQGSSSNCSHASGEVYTYDHTNSSFGNAVETPPANNAQLATEAQEHGCLYSGPTTITLSTTTNAADQPVGQMTVTSPDTPEPNGVDTINDSGNDNSCPNDGSTVALPANGVVYVQTATAAQTQAWANPFDDPISNSATNVTSSAAPKAGGSAVNLTATVTSQSSQMDSGATVAFSQTATTGSGKNQKTTTSTISGCTAQALSTPKAVSPTTSPPTYTSTATCNNEKPPTGWTAYSAVYSGGSSATTSSGNYGQTNSYTPSFSYGPYAQVPAGGCSDCYFGNSNSASASDAEGDAFVNGSLSGQLTIGTQNDVIVDGNITYADCSGQWTTGQDGNSGPSTGFCPYTPSGTNDVLGLIADNYVEVNRPILASTSNKSAPTVAPSCGATPAATCDPSDGTDGITIDAAILALTQSFLVNNNATGGTEGNLTVYGSVQQFGRGPVGTFDGDSVSTGYVKYYTWDPLLDFVSPPSYLVPSTPSWTLESVTTNAGDMSTNVCPPLTGVFQGSATGPALTQTCSLSPGGLPNYPSTTAPSPPTIGTATANADGSATVTWADPSGNGATITGYTVSANPACDSCTFTNLSDPNATSTTITGLTPGTTYSFTVTATNSLGTSSPSAPSNTVTIPSVPAAPTNVSATTNANGTATVSWVDPTSNGSPVTSYSVIPSPACASCTFSNLNGASITSATVTGLTPGSAYTFTVTATNGLGTSPASAASNAVTMPTVPGVPTNVSATAGAANAVVKWSAPSSNGGSAVTGYMVTPYIGGVAQTSQTFVSTATSETVTGLTNGTAYTFTVAAINGVGTGGQSAPSAAVTPAGAPGAPTNATATAGNGQVTVSWTPPADSGGTAITKYTVTSNTGGKTCTYTVITPETDTCTVTGLTNGTTYTFTVTATNSAGTGSASSPSNSATPVTVPGAPTTVSGTAGSKNSGKITVSWRAPTSTGGSAIQGYVVTPYVGGKAQTAQTFSSTATSETLTLTSGTSYTFTVAAYNAIGTGSQSSASSSVKAP